MTHTELNDEIDLILSEANLNIHTLRTNYAKENAKYKKGDFIKNVTGIIKIDSIGYNTLHNTTDITYTGYPYKMIKGILTRTKDTKKRTLVYNITPI
jgi:hypothetical protein